MKIFSALKELFSRGPRPTIRTVRAGYWNDPSTWDMKRVPLPSDLVQIRHSLTIPNPFEFGAKPIGRHFDNMNQQFMPSKAPQPEEYKHLRAQFVPMTSKSGPFGDASIKPLGELFDEIEERDPLLKESRKFR